MTNSHYLAKSEKQSEDAIEDFLAIRHFCTVQQDLLSEKQNLERAVSICGTFIARFVAMLKKE